MPAGFYQVPGLPYPQTPTDPGRNRGLFGEVIDPAMEPDTGVGAAPPRDPAMTALPPVQDRATQTALTRLQPSRTSPFSGRDAQALKVLDPRALDEANQLASLDQPKEMTATFGGQNFSMQPNARVDRNNLAGIYNKYQGLKAQERQDAVRAQEQGGRERIVAIPGQQATERRGMELGTEERLAGADRQFRTPTRDADIAAKQAGTAGAIAEQQRAGQSFAERVTPQQAALEEAYQKAAASPFAQTPAGRAVIAKLFPQTAAGRALPAQDAQALGEAAVGSTAPDVGEVSAQIMADPGISQLVEQARSTKPGIFTGTRGRQTNAAARQLAERAIRARIARGGGTPDDAQQLITSVLGPMANNRSGITINGVEVSPQ